MLLNGLLHINCQSRKMLDNYQQSKENVGGHGKFDAREYVLF